MVIIRKAEVDDCRNIVKLIKELAEYEDMPDGPRITEDVLQKDGFGSIPFFHCMVAETDNEKDKKEVIGYALYFFIYSTWEGKAIYMEDLYVSPSFRHQGIGMSLWKSVAQEGIKAGCSRLDFCVLNWNKSAIEFYQSKGAVNISETEGWNLFRLKKDALKNLAAI